MNHNTPAFSLRGRPPLDVANAKRSEASAEQIKHQPRYEKGRVQPAYRLDVGGGRFLASQTSGNFRPDQGIDDARSQYNR